MESEEELELDEESPKKARKRAMVRRPEAEELLELPEWVLSLSDEELLESMLLTVEARPDEARLERLLLRRRPEVLPPSLLSLDRR